MIDYIFYGGKEILVVRTDKDRNVSLKYPALTGEEFITLERIKPRMSRSIIMPLLFKFNIIKNNATDEEFEKYIIFEFTQKQYWKGFEFKHKKEWMDGLKEP